MTAPELKVVTNEAAELEARIERAREARAQRDVRMSEETRLERLREEAEAEERALKEDEILDELVAKHGPLGKKIKRVDTSEGMIVVKKPNHLLFKKYQDKGSTETQELEKLVRPCLLHPDKATFDRICEEVPAALMKAANAVCALAGIGRDDILGK